jgi:hypothetical protein
VAVLGLMGRVYGITRGTRCRPDKGGPAAVAGVARAVERYPGEVHHRLGGDVPVGLIVCSSARLSVAGSATSTRAGSSLGGPRTDVRYGARVGR